ncbi:MAG: glutaredoxin family protein [bacterium]
MIVYVKPGCACCQGAIAYAEYEGIPFRVINVLEDLPRYRGELVRLIGKAAVPVFVQGESVRLGFKNLSAGCGGWCRVPEETAPIKGS